MSAIRESEPSFNPALTILIFSLFVLLVYSNTFDASWHLDDYHVIPQNPGIHISELDLQSLGKAATADPYTGERLYRPVAMLSFALNWYLHQDALPGYHLVNIAVHILATFMLFCVIRELFRTPRLKHTPQEDVRFIAWMAVLLWSLNPVQVQAVTYIVQRMTSLAALFYVMGIWSFLRGRRTSDPVKRGLIWAGCAAMYLLAVGSKENAITLPLALVLVELLFFPHSGLKLLRPKWIAGVLLAVLVLAGLSTVLIYSSRGSVLEFLTDLYARRPFTFAERILTEPRIIWYYLSLLFYPIPPRLSIEYDIALSVSLWQPWTTLPAIIGLAGLMIAGVALARPKPLVSLAVLYFLVNHIPESTVLPLELAFEHRNYLPSMFLFIPVAAALKRLIDHYQSRSKRFAVSLAVFISLLVAAFGSGTYIRNMAWATEKSLWEDARRKAPTSPRPLVNLAAKYYEPIGRVDLAVALNHEALRLSDGQPKQFKAICLKNIGNYYYIRGAYEKALAHYDEALKQDPAFVEARLNRNRVLASSGRLDEALDGVSALIEEQGKKKRFLELQGSILASQSRFAEALTVFRKGLGIAPQERKALLNIGACLSLLGYYDQAGLFLGRCSQLYPGDPMALLWTVENQLRNDRRKQAAERLDRWIDREGLRSLEEVIKQYVGAPLSFPVDFRLARALMAERLAARIAILGQTPLR